MKRTLITALCAMMVFTPLMARKKTPSAELPILAWYSIPGGQYATLDHYRELKECGFTISFSHTYNQEDALQALDLCRQAGLKSMFMCPELETSSEETVRKVKGHPALYGYFLRDEPTNEALDALGNWARRIQQADDQHPCYLNLLPTHAFPGDWYDEHLRLFNEKVPLPQISYDHYPVNQVGDSLFLNAAFYKNLEQVSAECKRVGKPFWAFALATAHGSYPIPTIDQLRVQMYSNLAYGAQLLQYFTYWNPGTETWDFHQAPVTQQGKRSTTYDLVREFNQELQRRAFVWVGSQMQSVCHLGETIPLGTTRMTSLPDHFMRLEAEEGTALVSTLANGDKRYVMIVNTSPSRPARLQVETDGQVQRIRRDATLVPADRYESLHILSPGDAEIYCYASVME